MKANVVVKQLMMYVSANDQSYMPKEVVISVGKGNSLREIKEVSIQRFVSLLTNSNTIFNFFLQ